VAKQQGARGGVVVKALRFKPAGCGFDSSLLRASKRRSCVLRGRRLPSESKAASSVCAESGSVTSVV
jgi:hypothetical protein